MLLGIALSALLTCVVVTARIAVARFFLGHAAPDADATIQLAATLLLIGATLFIPDGLQATASGALRGLKDTRVPLLFAAISYWLIGFSAAYAFAFLLPFGAIGVWVGLSLGTAVHATLLILRFLRLSRGFSSA
jgi:MATE family multidrug resistance protein